MSIKTDAHAPCDAIPKEALYLNRELSWLEFNRRILHQATDSRIPILERVHFLSIFGSNLDEFVMKRLSGLKRQQQAGVVAFSMDGMRPKAQLEAIRETLRPMLTLQAACYRNDVVPTLADHGIHILKYEELTDSEQVRAKEYFYSNVFPVLTPLAVDPGHPFPFISNLSVSLGILLRHPEREEKLFSRVKIPESLAPFIQISGNVGGESIRFVSLIEILRHNLDHLFPDMIVLDVMPFRVTRNVDVEREEEDADDLMELIEEELRARRFAQVVRLEHGPDPEPWMLRFLMEELELDREDLYEMSELLDYSALRQISSLEYPELRFKPWTPLVPPWLSEDETDFFAIIRKGSLLVHHPFESFGTSVERFVLDAADDPKVQAIKMTVYRTGDQSPLIQALIRAAQAGKQVVCVVEVKARFDEQRNIYWAQQLEKAGVHVVYGIVGLKTQVKSVLVVRKEPEGLRVYAHIGTGNYNAQTARYYTDLGLFTCRPDVTRELVEMFNFLTGRSLKNDYRHILVAPANMRIRFVEMIRREMEHKKAGRPAGIIAKMNAMADQEIGSALYEASQAGVPIDLIVRGFCCLRPGVEKLSENIRVVSVVGRFLEHSRIYHFMNGARDPIEGEFFIGSADWMYRNLEKRVGVVIPVIAKAMRHRLWEILQIVKEDRFQAWDMMPDGQYVLRNADSKSAADAATGTHQRLMDLTRQMATRKGTTIGTLAALKNRNQT